MDTQLHTGDVIYRNPKGFGYRHYGVLLQKSRKSEKGMYVHANHSGESNSLEEWLVLDNFPGRGVSVTPLEDWMLCGYSVAIEKKGILSPEYIEKNFVNVKDRPFHATEWNCEHFANYVAGHTACSRQVANAALLALYTLYI